MQAGDVVQLKSGGPKMTIRWVEQDEAYCEWFTEKGETQHATYVLEQLAPASLGMA